MKEDLLTAYQDYLGLLPQLVVFQLPNEPHCCFLIALERPDHFVVNHRVELAHHLAFLFFLFKPFNGRNIFKAKNDALLIIKLEACSPHDER